MPYLTDAETALAARAGFALSRAGIPFGGPSPVAVFQGPIGEALAFCGAPAADPTAINDRDVLRLSRKEWFRFLDVAELLTLELAGSRLVLRPAAQRWADYSAAFDVRSFTAHLAGRRQSARLKWGFGASALTAGTIDLGFAATSKREF